MEENAMAQPCDIQMSMVESDGRECYGPTLRYTDVNGRE